MAEVSDRLRAARERAGLQIEDIAARTKIKVAQLQAIERGEFERLPGEFFTRAFLRTYAREVGLPPDEIVLEYDASRGEAGAALEAARGAGPQPNAGLPRVAAPALLGVDPDEHEFSGRLFRPPSPGSIWPVVALALLLLVGISVMNRQPEGSEEPAATATRSAAPEPQPAGTSGQAAPAPDPAPRTLSIEISPSAVIWINAKTDGELALYRLVQPGERVKLEARHELTFRIGNAAAFQYWINGVPGRILGGAEEVREFQITRENFRTYHR